MTHLHLRRASSLQTAFYTVSLWDYPNFEHLCHSDVKQISGRVANPVASPKPDVGIHFEVITQEGPIVIPLCFSNSLGEPHIHPGCLSHTQTHTDTHRLQCHQIWPSLRSCAFRSWNSLWCFCKRKEGGKKRKSWKCADEEEERAAVPPAQFRSLHGDDDAGNKFSRFVLFRPLLYVLLLLFPTNFST